MAEKRQGKTDSPFHASGSDANQPGEGGAVVVYPPLEESQRQMQRILQSAAFRNSHMLQQLLQFLVAQAYGPEAETLKEYTIGVGALSRPQDFDPKTDPIVRVQTLRLRQKLREYYDSEGKQDPIVIEIPKGHYAPTFEAVNGSHRFGQSASEHKNAIAPNGAPGVEQDTQTQAPALVGKQRRNGRVWRRAAIAAAGALIFLTGLWIGSRLHLFSAGAETASATSASGLNPLANSVKAFWGDLIGNDATPIIAHADAVFLLDRHNDLFWFPHGASDYRGAPVDPHLAQQFAGDPTLVARAGKLYYEDVYLGSGDLDAVASMSNLFGLMGLKPIIEPGKALTPTDLKQHNVILVGSSFQSYAVAQFNTLGDFSFVNPDPNGGGWRGIIVNAHPRPGEQSIYRTDRDPDTGVLKTDHALITVQPGVVPGRFIVDLGGLDTTGCAGAAMFATSVTGVDQLKKALAAEGIHGTNGGPPLFQALLSVRLEKGDEVLGASLLAVHPLFTAQSVSNSPKNQKTAPPSQ